MWDAGFDNLAHAPRGTPTDDSLVTVQLNEDTGAMRVSSTVNAMNPSFIRHHPSKDIIYVATECIDENGDVLAYKHDRATGELTSIGDQSAQGASTCFISVTPNQQRAPSLLPNRALCRCPFISADIYPTDFFLVVQHTPVRLTRAPPCAPSRRQTFSL